MKCDQSRESNTGRPVTLHPLHRDLLSPDVASAEGAHRRETPVLARHRQRERTTEKKQVILHRLEGNYSALEKPAAT